MFSGIMNAKKLKLILGAGLLPFIQEKFPDGHKLFQDQDPKHASNAIEEFFERNNVEWSMLLILNPLAAFYTISEL